MINFLKVLSSIFFFCALPLMQAEAGVAKVISSNGKCYAVQGNNKRAISRGSEISQNEKVVTGKNGNLQMRFTDNGLISLRPNSEYIVKNYHYKENERKGKHEATLVKGQLRSLTGLIGKESPKDYSLSTKSTTIGVAGTSFTLSSSSSGDCGDEIAGWAGQTIGNLGNGPEGAGPTDYADYLANVCDRADFVVLPALPASYTENFIGGIGEGPGAETASSYNISQEDSLSLQDEEVVQNAPLILSEEYEDEEDLEEDLEEFEEDEEEDEPPPLESKTQG